MPYTTDTTRWRALATRDPNANGHFIYTVKSTGIYCRPTCPARLARRANVGFFKQPSEAEAAGFRACKRCKPDVDEVEDPQGKAVALACGLIEAAAAAVPAPAASKMEELPKNNFFKLQDLAKKVGLTPRYFHKIFKNKMGLTPREYAKIAAAQQGRTTSMVAAAPGESSAQTDVEPLGWDAVDIGKFVRFDVNASVPLVEDFSGAAPGADEIDELSGLQQCGEGLYEDAGSGTSCVLDYDTPFYPANEGFIPMDWDQRGAVKSASAVSLLEIDGFALLDNYCLIHLEAGFGTVDHTNENVGC